MAFKIRKLNHTPQWYHDHCRAEDGGSPAFRAMLKRDMAFIAADNDSHLTYQEKIDAYEEKWNDIMAHWRSEGVDPHGVLTREMLAVTEREAVEGFRPGAAFEREPFSTISELMLEHNINPETMRQFLTWRSRQEGVRKREGAREAERERKTKEAQSLLDRFLKRAPRKPLKAVEQEPRTVEPEPPETPDHLPQL